ncbi:class I SAM-dependent methyltransferase [Aspergillus mulundensis]|uniref:Methyltransferase type 11 domain-containing protein n=1 Tax=Aspergillus mulundensis TaxID=1810919 RepID=A0A3D8RJZ9_9EURO|nr:Uncharacterized protein DSM5745_06962 [Aspergillus mulundensis]RDW74300.1 Uncharacterized protein DSM5745_06962 [Aspergillus mulundensis]
MARDDLTTRQWLDALAEPAQILTWAMSYYIEANIKAILSGRLLAPLLNAHQLRDEAFGKFWVAFSSNREEPPPSEQLSPEESASTGSISAPKAEEEKPQEKAVVSSDLIPPIISQATGVVLDVGPGTGTQMPLLAQIPASNIKAFYGAEPCLGLHAELRRRAAAHGLAETYKVLPCSVEQSSLEPELEKAGLLASPDVNGAVGKREDGVFDSIITIRVLCSVPDPQKTIAYLYSLLKPGGKLLLVEHVVNPWTTRKGSLVARVLQGVYHLFGWRWVMGDCCLNRDTEGMVRAVAEVDGGWESVEVDRWFEKTPMVYVAGVFVKRG